MFCLNCGKELPDDAKFCSGCGKQIEEKKEENINTVPVCSSCGEELKPGNKFCIKCGTAVNTEQDFANQSNYIDQSRNVSPNYNDNSKILVEFKTGSNSLSLTYANGKKIPAEDIFQCRSSSIVKDILIGASGEFIIKVEIYSSRIRFIKLTMFSKPTEKEFEIKGSDIASVQKVDFFLGKSVTVFDHSGGKFDFAVPKKQIENILSIINGMISQNNRH